MLTMYVIRELEYNKVCVVVVAMEITMYFAFFHYSTQTTFFSLKSESFNSEYKGLLAQTEIILA